MAETLEKLRPDRDLQCYWQQPTAVAALSATSPTGFTVSGAWRQQFDWAVIEWNRDNTFEHPLFRYLPDGDLSGLQLSYQEIRTNCIPLDSDLYATVDFPYLRVWAADSTGTEQLYKVPLRQYATALDGYQAAAAPFQLRGTATVNDYVGLSWGAEQYNHQFAGGESLADAITAIVSAINAISTTMRAAANGQTIQLTPIRPGETIATSTTGSNGNRIGVYGFVSGAGTESWQPQWQQLSGGVSPARWQIALDFSNLKDQNGNPVPTTAVRKMRWTYAADMQTGAYQRGEFSVVVSNWTVTGARRTYSVAGPGSRRIEGNAQEASYSGVWQSETGNYSGGSIHYTTKSGSSVTVAYSASGTHSLYLGVRKIDLEGATPVIKGTMISIVVDNQPALSQSLLIPTEDVLVRIPLGEFGSGPHTVTVTHGGQDGEYFYFDFLELAVPAASVTAITEDAHYALATDWDTAHSLALGPERTAWMISSLGFQGRVNHYVGALWFYELVGSGWQYASGTIDFVGTPVFSQATEIAVAGATITHLNRIGETAATLAKAFEMLINNNYPLIRAAAQGTRLTIFARAAGSGGNSLALSASPSSGDFQLQASGTALAGGADGNWLTDLTVVPRLNRAARDWNSSFFAALKSAGLAVTAAFSTELQHGDPSTAAGIAQRYPSGDPVMVTTPALQTNFSPASLAFWQQAHLDMAQIMNAAGVAPYLQFGEVQWWYFPEQGSGMPFYDAYTTATFRSLYGRDMTVIAGMEAPADLPQECAFLPALIGQFTDAIMSFVRAQFPNCRFEVLYPLDVNGTPLNQVINLPAEWKPGVLDCFKTESFNYTYSRDLERCKTSILLGKNRGFPASQCSHLIGISDPISPWQKEARLAAGKQLESVVLFALDQFCLIGYAAPLEKGMRRSLFMG